MKRLAIVFFLGLLSTVSSYLHAEEYCVGAAWQCDSYNSLRPLALCEFQDGCYRNFDDECWGFARSCGTLSDSACKFQDGCLLFVKFDNLTLFGYQVDQVVPDQFTAAVGATPYLFRVNIDEASRAWASWTSVNKEVRIEYAYNNTSSWSHYETLQPGAASAVLCFSGKRLGPADYCKKMPSLYEGTIFFRFRIGNAPNWIYIRPVSFYYNS